MAHTDLVATVNENISQQSNSCTEKQENTFYLSNSPETVHSLYPELELILCHLSRDSLCAKDFRKNLRKSLKSRGTVGQLNSSPKWDLFCITRNIDPLHPAIQEGINFLAEVFATGIGCSCSNTKRLILDYCPSKGSKLWTPFFSDTLVEGSI